MPGDPVANDCPHLTVYDRLVAATETRHRLFSVHWELTYRCNQRCSHCYLSVLPPNTDRLAELTTKECLRVIDELTELGALNLTLSGGEILTRRDLFEIAEYARSKRMLLRLFTNGILITPSVADRVAALHPYAIEISLYGVDPQTHDGITGLPGSWRLTTQALALLHDRGVRTIVKVLLMRENCRELRDLRKLATDLGAQFRYDTIVTAKDDSGCEPLHHRLTYQELVCLFREMLDSEAWGGRRVARDARTCRIGSNGLTLDPYGNVFPCVQTRELVGTCRKQSLKAIWEKGRTWRPIAELTVHDLPVCRECGLLNLCLRCHGLAQIEGGDLRGPSFAHCREALARRQVLVERGALAADYPIPAHLAQREIDS